MLIITRSECETPGSLCCLLLHTTDLSNRPWTKIFTEQMLSRVLSLHGNEESEGPFVLPVYWLTFLFATSAPFFFLSSAAGAMWALMSMTWGSDIHHILMLQIKARWVGSAGNSDCVRGKPPRLFCIGYWLQNVWALLQLCGQDHIRKKATLPYSWFFLFFLCVNNTIGSVGV